MHTINLQALREVAARLGLAIVGVAKVSGFEQERDRLIAWQQAGHAGDMAYMQRDAGLLSDPLRLMGAARTVVSIGAYYDRGPREPLRPGYGRVARYAWGRDYHKVLRVRLERLAVEVSRLLGGDLAYRVFSDSVPLLERAVARQAGLGFIGKNTMLIIPRAGSFLFLGEIVCDLEVTGLPEEASAPTGSCGECSRCLNGCPTGAFVSERVLDARRCISYLTIEKRGVLLWHEREAIGDWLFGCDVCQDLCPFNALPLRRRLPPTCAEFSPVAGVGQMVSLAEVLSLRTDAEYVARFGGTPLMRAKREGLVRNAATVAANVGFFELTPKLRTVFLSDPSGVVRAHSLWSVARLSRGCGSAARADTEDLIRRGLQDSDPAVQEEARQCEQLVS
jgi:epoxyqueuosine reductase